MTLKIVEQLITKFKQNLNKINIYLNLPHAGKEEVCGVELHYYLHFAPAFILNESRAVPDCNIFPTCRSSPARRAVSGHIFQTPETN